MADRPAFARAAESDPLGKLDVRIDVNVPETVKDDAGFVARATGYRTTSEWVRSLVYRELYGQVDTIQRLVSRGGGVNGKNG